MAFATPIGMPDPPDPSRWLDRLGLGTSGLHSDRADLAFQVLDAWLAVGGRLIDTAASYGDGGSERVIGAWLRSRGARDSVVLLTNGGHPAATGLVLSWSPVANGFFRADADLDEDRFTAYRSPLNNGRRERAAALGARLGVTMPQIALAWVLGQASSPFASIGTTSPAHLAEAVAATDIRLTEAELRWLEDGEA